MANMNPRKTPMPVQDPLVRAHNFEEVATGYTAEMAAEEAERCLHCKNPRCVEGCPVNVQIPDFIKKIAEGDPEGAYQVITATNALPAISGRVCPQESQCEARCVRGIKGESVGIGRLERYVADYHRTHAEEAVSPVSEDGPRVAVIGSGPAGLTCAADLKKLGYRPEIFEALHEAGGVLTYGIPQFRLPKEIVHAEVEKLEAMGVKVNRNVVVGRTISVDELLEEGFSAAFIGSGAGLPRFMGIPGEGMAGVCSANEYLTRINLMKGYKPGYDTPVIEAKKVAVVGGGNVAMDACRCAMRMGAEKVYIIYRRGDEEMPARREEIEHAREEGIEFLTLCNPVEFISGETEDGKKTGVVARTRCIRMALGEPDASGRRSPTEIPGSEFTLETDLVIMALGTRPNPLLRSTTPGLQADKRGCLVVSEDGTSTSRAGVFAGGDAVTGAATVILAMGAGKKAAKAIDEYLKK